MIFILLPLLVWGLIRWVRAAPLDDNPYHMQWPTIYHPDFQEDLDDGA